jgi:serine/threonine-protein kinase
MEYVPGTDLKSMIEREGALPSRTVAHIGEQVCAALSVAHGYGIIHRDIKPHNIMVQADGAVKLMDFGIARAGPSMKTQTGSVLGTAQYLSPEAALGTPLTTASDLYSLGVVLYEAATGLVPFDGDTPVAVALKQVNEEAALPHLANPDIDPALGAVIVKAMQKQTADRYVSAGDLQRDLSAIAQGRSPGVAAGYAGMVAGLGVPGTTPHVAPTAVMPQVVAAEPEGQIEPSEDLEAPEPTVPADAPRRRLVWPWVVLAALLVLIVVAGLSALWGRGLRDSQGDLVPEVVTPSGTDSVADPVVVPEEPEMIDVPDVIGMREAEAVETLERAGFVPEALPSQFNTDVRKGRVFEQMPPSADAAPKGAVVTYRLSLGADPNARGTRGRGDDDDD